MTVGLFLVSGVARGVYLMQTRTFTQEQLKNMNAILVRGVGCFSLAFIIWNLDNVRSLTNLC